MAQQNKTQPTDADVEAFLAAVEPAPRQADARAVCDLLAMLSDRPPKMWGPSIVGFGQYHYRYESGREGDAPCIGFSPRKAALTLYLMGIYADGGMAKEPLLAKLGKFTAGKGCLYIKRLSDVDLGVLEALAVRSLAHVRRTYPHS
ncbi:DUF1801 domain-containing protein [Phenylobacterium sp.]|uniref:DUF1801 domain-containing protein n=1 Tax=Phenylobacterium sp. TaxID=1871053 RepID=UPI002723C2CE|nr:DUF1801 domain-containing protein [Phenylobacterium sp.]MDO8380198.1 DUF1801 domain-containing protein [Phenylobacterium sp.]